MHQESCVGTTSDKVHSPRKMKSINYLASPLPGGDYRLGDFGLGYHLGTDWGSLFLRSNHDCDPPPTL